MSLNYEKIGKRIKHIRKEKGWSQEVLAEKVNCNQYQISLLESAKTGICDLFKLEKISDVLGIPLDLLIFGESGEKNMKKSEEIYSDHLRTYVEEEQQFEIKKKELDDKINKIKNTELYNKIRSAFYFYTFDATDEVEGFVTYARKKDNTIIYKDISLDDDIVCIVNDIFSESKRHIEKDLIGNIQDVDKKEHMKLEYQSVLDTMYRGFYDTHNVEDEILNEYQIKKIMYFLYEQNTDIKNYVLDGIDFYSSDGVMLIFESELQIESNYQACFLVYYNKEDETCEFYKYIWHKEDNNEEGVVSFSIDPAKDFQDAVLSGLCPPNSMPFLMSYIESSNFNELPEMIDKQYFDKIYDIYGNL